MRNSQLNPLMIITLCLCAPALAGESVGGSKAPHPEDQLAFFETLKETLPGRWEGQFADGSFDIPTSEWRPTRVDYYLSAGDTAIVENYLGRDESTVGMTTVYHLDNNDIRATHFCGAQNHPRMIARAFDPVTRTLALGFVDVTNLKAVDDYHSREIELTLVDEDNIRLTFFGLEDGERNSRVFALSRMRNQAREE